MSFKHNHRFIQNHLQSVQLQRNRKRNDVIIVCQFQTEAANGFWRRQFIIAGRHRIVIGEHPKVTLPGQRQIIPAEYISAKPAGFANCIQSGFGIVMFGGQQTLRRLRNLQAFHQRTQNVLRDDISVFTGHFIPLPIFLQATAAAKTVLYNDIHNQSVDILDRGFPWNIQMGSLPIGRIRMGKLHRHTVANHHLFNSLKI